MCTAGWVDIVCDHTGAGGEAGLLPRALVSVFLKLSGRLYPDMDLKPVLSQEVRKLDAREVRAEEIRRDALLKEVKRETGTLEM